MENFTPISAFIGGMLIGCAAILIMWTNGKIAGISGILGGILFRAKGDYLWRLLFVAGLLLAVPIYMLVAGNAVTIVTQSNSVLTVIAGVLVGLGSRMGSGCTSGHGICGISRVSQRSFAATATFMATGIATVFVLRHILGVTG